MSSPLYTDFVARYREALFTLIPDERPYYFTYRRILVRARF